MRVSGISQFERFFRAAAGLDVDKSDLKRVDEFVHHEIYDQLVIAEGNAKANGRDIIQWRDLPVTKGLQEQIHEFDELGEETGVEPVLERLATWPPLDLDLSEEAEANLPRLAGGISIALARSFTILDSKLTNPSTEHWERAFRLFDLLL